jgi:hypothetical protein
MDVRLLIAISDLIYGPSRLIIDGVTMTGADMNENGLSCIDSRMTVLDIISRYRETEAVFKAWDRRAGECICCRALFETVQQVADRYGLNLDRLMAELNAAVRN